MDLSMAELERAVSKSVKTLRRDSSILVLTVPGGYAAYDVRSRVMHKLNPTAALIVELADGTRTISDIIETISSVIGREKATRSERWITRACEQKMLVEV